MWPVVKFKISKAKTGIGESCHHHCEPITFSFPEDFSYEIVTVSHCDKME